MLVSSGIPAGNTSGTAACGDSSQKVKLSSM